jgi:hypothetical protein
LGRIPSAAQGRNGGIATLRKITADPDVAGWQVNIRNTKARQHLQGLRDALDAGATTHASTSRSMVLIVNSLKVTANK